MFNNVEENDLINCILIKLNDNDKQLLQIYLEDNFINIYPHFKQLTITNQMLVFSNYWTDILVHKASRFNTIETRYLLKLENEIRFYINTFINLIFPKLKEYGVIV